jgi:hypothetical protein
MRTHPQGIASAPCSVDKSVPSGWPGLVSWFVLHWRGQLSVYRSLVVSACVSLLPANSFFVMAFFAIVAFGDDSRLADILLHAGYWGIPLGLLWWAAGTHRKFLNLLADGRMSAGLLAFAVSIGGLMLTGLMAYDAFKTTFPKKSAYARMVEGCERGDSTWVNKPWSVVAMPELNRIVATGSIGRGSAAELERVVRQHPELRLLELDSPGGFVSEKLRMIELVEQRGLDTLVLGRCISACTGVFLAGQRRYVTPSSRFGFHRSGYCGMPANAPWGTPEHLTYLQYRESGVDGGFAYQALATSHYDLWRPSALDVKRGRFATHWWSERPEEYSRAAVSQ